MLIGALDGVLAGPRREMTWEQLFETAAGLGFAGMELGVGPDYDQTKLWDEAGRRELTAAAEGAGVVASSVCLHSYWQYSFASPDEDTRSRSRDLAREAAVATAEVGAVNILVPLTCPKEVGAEEARSRWIDGVKACAPAAEKAGAVFCLENVGQPFANRPEEIIAVVDAIGSAAVKVYYDPGNAVGKGDDPLDAIARYGERIAQIHVKEREGTHLGEGIVPWKEIIPALMGVGFDGWLVLETEATDDPEGAARKNLDHLRGLIG